MTASSTPRHEAQPLPLSVLFEDEHLLAVDKAAGVVAHPGYKHAAGSVFNALLWHLRGTGVHPHLLQRLDKDTTGVMLVSKTMRAHAVVARAMQRARPGAVRKEYLAVVSGLPAPASGKIALRLRRDPDDTRRVVASSVDGKESLTRYWTLGRSANANVSVLLCEPVTGRMHQIRVHLAACGWPLVGDRVYGPADQPAAPIARQALHAWRLSLTHPVSRAPLAITAPVPPDMTALLESAALGGF